MGVSLDVKICLRALGGSMMKFIMKFARHGGGDMILRHLNFRQISCRFTWYFANTPFHVLNVSYIVYKNMTIPNPSGCSRAPLLK